MPSSRMVQLQRRKAIVEILMQHKIRNQQELLDELEKRGISATQSSVSRDLKEMGARRIDGFYEFPKNPEEGEEDFERIAHFVRKVTTVEAYFTILKTEPGAGPIVGRAVEAGNWPEVGGVVSGADSVLIITREDWDEQDKLLDRLRKHLDLIE
jgi:transcriptional regulator of arginine metabolism